MKWPKYCAVAKVNPEARTILPVRNARKKTTIEKADKIKQLGKAVFISAYIETSKCDSGKQTDRILPEKENQTYSGWWTPCQLSATVCFYYKRRMLSQRWLLTSCCPWRNSTCVETALVGDTVRSYAPCFVPNRKSIFYDKGSWLPRWLATFLNVWSVNAAFPSQVLCLDSGAAPCSKVSAGWKTC